VRAGMGKKAAKDLAAIEICFIWYPQFLEDFEMLLERKIMTRESRDKYHWNYSKTSLAEYFNSLESRPNVPGGKWNPVETAFGIKRDSLRHLASPNGRDRPEGYRSQDFEKILVVLAEHRKQERNRRNFREIKSLIEKTDPRDNEGIKKTLEKIKKMF
jgi:hypothetical protein